jgi:hypothetical protein
MGGPGWPGLAASVLPADRRKRAVRTFPSRSHSIPPEISDLQRAADAETTHPGKQAGSPGRAERGLTGWYERFGSEVAR